MERKNRITIVQVAEEAGVSKQTVSRVLNNRPDVAPETRRHIQEIIERLNYKPSAVARSLIQQRSFTIGVVTAGLKYIGPSRTLNGITSKAEKLGYSILLIELQNYKEKDILPTIDTLDAHSVDGIIWAIQEVDENRSYFKSEDFHLKTPIIFLTTSESQNISSINIDNQNSAMQITTHLIEQGCQHIGHIAGPLDWWEAKQRKLGWEKALKKNERDFSIDMWCEGNWSSQSGKVAFERLMKKYPHMDGLFVSNDQMALGVFQGAHEAGVRIPVDLAVVGFDGISDSAFFWPPLSTVVQDQHELGCVAVSELVKMIDSYQEKESMIENQLCLNHKL